MLRLLFKEFFTGVLVNVLVEIGALIIYAITFAIIAGFVAPIGAAVVTLVLSFIGFAVLCRFYLYDKFYDNCDPTISHYDRSNTSIYFMQRLDRNKPIKFNIFWLILLPTLLLGIGSFFSFFISLKPLFAIIIKNFSAENFKFPYCEIIFITLIICTLTEITYFAFRFCYYKNKVRCKHCNKVFSKIRLDERYHSNRYTEEKTRPEKVGEIRYDNDKVDIYTDVKYTRDYLIESKKVYYRCCYCGADGVTDNIITGCF